MGNGSPTAYLLWAILSSIFLAFLLLHLWSYDRFACLKWDAGRQPGTFKRVMTYSYIATVPLLVVFSVAMSVIKYKEGFFVLPNGHIVPRPFSLWSKANRSWILPLYFVLSFAWSFELVTHLEELTFWLFLLHQGPRKREWFHSWEFRAWYTGSIIAVLGMPLTALITRRNLETCQAWVFLVGSSAGTCTTLCFLYVLIRFPAFIRHVKLEGAEPDIVVRLATFYQLNRIRVMFRFLFTLPLLIVAADGIQSPYPVVRDPFGLDFLLMVGGIGCFISSAITLLIFFPRSVTRESGYQAKITPPQTSAKHTGASALPNYSRHHVPPSPKLPLALIHPGTSVSGIQMNAFRFPDDSPPPRPFHTLNASSQHSRRDSIESSELSLGYDSDVESIHTAMPPELAPSSATGARSDDTVWERQEHSPASARRRHSGSAFAPTRAMKPAGTAATAAGSEAPVPWGGRREPPPTSQLHPYVLHFTSPIDLVDLPDLDIDSFPDAS